MPNRLLKGKVQMLSPEGRTETRLLDENTGRLYLKPSIKTDEFEAYGCHGTNLEIHPHVPSALPLP